MKKYLFLFHLMFYVLSSAQESGDYIPKVYPSSPDTYNLGTYGNINIGEYTGTMSHSIPLYEYTIGDIKFPVSLQYSSNGIKVDEYNPVVGLGWSLSAHGIISKIVRDREDGLSGGDIKWQNDNTPDPNNGGYPALRLNFYENAGLQDLWDTEKDLFRVNIPGGFSNSFVKKIGGDGWLQEKKTDFKIETITTPDLKTGFLITAPDGIKYYFELVETSTNRVHGGGRNMPDISLSSAFFLTRIEDTKNNIMYFEYEPAGSSYTSHKSDVYNFFVDSYNFNCSADVGGLPLSGIAGFHERSNLVRYDTYRIKSISNNINQQRIAFNYVTKFSDTENRGNFLDEVTLYGNSKIDSYKLDYLITPNNRVFLRKVYSTISQKVHEFEYINPELLPKRLSNAQDFWGYYNGVTQNRHLISKVENLILDNINFSFANRELNEELSQTGLLSKIVYPTKGYTKIHYEPHTKWGEKTDVAPAKSKSLSVMTDQSTWTKTESTTFYSGKKQQIKFIGGASFNQEDCSSNTHQVRVYLKVKNLSTGEYEDLLILNSLGYGTATNTFFYPGGENIFYVDVEAATEYEVSLEVLRMCHGGGVSFKYIDTPDDVYDTNLPVGGNRVAKVEDYAGGASAPVITKWYYAHKDNLSRSSGVSYHKPILWNYSEGVHYCPPPEGNPAFYKYTPYRYISVHSNSLIPLFGNESQNVSYEYVTKSVGGEDFENGGKFTEYIVDIDPIASNLFGSGNYRGGNFTNQGWNKGFVKKEEVLKKTGNSLSVVKETINEYKYIQSNREEINNIIGIPHGGYQRMTKLTYYCTEEDITKQGTGYNPCYGQSTGYYITYLPPERLGMFVELLQYKFISHDYNLAKTTTNEVLDDKIVKTTIDYNYNSPHHKQLTSQVTELSDGGKTTTNYRYAQEQGNQYLKEKNMVGVPILTEVKKTVYGETRTISKVETRYPVSTSDANSKTAGLPLPYSVLSYDNHSADTYLEITYDKYDSKGKLLQYSEKGVKPTAIVWGYNQSHPIAKIEGATYSQVSPHISGIVSKSNADAVTGTTVSEQELITALDNFRTNSALSGFQITTYTYDPLIGVTSITPPSGIREIYKYDPANRLEKVVDVNGHLLKEYKYHYKN
ncbi:hypothetical protein [Sinomicrobium pectinilyticum]|nr:hypothetical protein [Sinomicrobium pectinilyticum]